MRRLLLIATVIALLVGATTSVAYARFASTDSAPGPKAAPFRAPAAAPHLDRTQADSYVFRSAASIGAEIQRAAAPATPAPAAAPAGGAGASVTVTATVLPVVFIIVGEDGHVTELVTNTEERDATGVVYLVRSGSTSGDVKHLTADTWAEARAALAHAHAGVGTIWTA